MFLRKRFYYTWGAGLVLCALGIVWMPIMYIGVLCIVLLVAATIFEYISITQAAKQLRASRRVDLRMSLGDDNPVTVRVINSSDKTLSLELIDELPLQFQERNFGREFTLNARSDRQLKYSLRPTERGIYAFGRLLLFAGTNFGLVERRLSFGGDSHEVAVYPSIIQMKQQLLRVRQLLRREGSEAKQRRFARSYEFDQIKNYVAGDDYRLLNWKATARTNELMLNTYVEERSQQIVALIDTSRTMLSPFDGLSLLDYSINSSLALLNVALQRGDRVGLLGFDKGIHTRVPAAARPEHMQRILEVLYKQESTDHEPDYGALYQYVRRQVKGRSLLMLYTNFETVISLERNLPVLRQMARAHLLVVVMFVNSKISDELANAPATLEEAYLNTIAGEYDANQVRIAATLRNHGILVMRTTPQELTANAVSEYLSVKTTGRL